MHTLRISKLLQVEEPQQQEEKKGKGKASGKRFEIKKWNAVAMCVLRTGAPVWVVDWRDTVVLSINQRLPSRAWLLCH